MRLLEIISTLSILSAILPNMLRKAPLNCLVSSRDTSSPACLYLCIFPFVAFCSDSGKHGITEPSAERSAELFFKNFRNGSKWSKYTYVRVIAYSERYFSRYEIFWKTRNFRLNSAEFFQKS